LETAARLFAFAYVRAEMETKAKELRNYNATLFDSAPIGLAVFSEECKIVDSNEAFLRMHGVDKQTLLKHFFHLLPEFQPDGMKSADKAIDIMKRTLAGEQMVIEWMHKSATGEPVPSELTLTSMIRDGKRYGLAYIYDLRYVKTLEADTKQHHEKAAMTRVWERAYKDLRKKVEKLGINVDQL
jgi:PAS domain S-box-containing protein